MRSPFSTGRGSPESEGSPSSAETCLCHRLRRRVASWDGGGAGLFRAVDRALLRDSTLWTGLSGEISPRTRSSLWMFEN